ncbi:MAG: YggS family pyridoxal phosphate-dependent enzyme [Thiofilum sp.]|uniref:YggS family pyridoxal phosphate-dependent enzyme n=1 Tax=Thiofilum sp. TaxID=2212733 RepID=UPI0025FAE5DF|nr:YggS family pyridoxal phosphate-dependent enzyme [Thiofilum sp.]MBK8452733.1 YggS family pyridoxal phosphate-dependent enzyme [Thiofilum sp.]
MTLKDKLQIIGERIHQAEQRFQRPFHSVRLVAVSKFHPVTALHSAYQAGQKAFGENYVQEMVAKAQALAHYRDIEWHFIGPLQSNKTKLVAETAHWVHTIERLKIAERLSQQRPPDQPDLNICLQVNLSAEASKSGIALDEVVDLALQVQQLPRLKLRGLMAIPAPESDFERQRAVFAKLRTALAELNQRGLMLDTLSMGMSDDMEAAIAEGATLVRIGTAIFGQRPSAA